LNATWLWKSLLWVAVVLALVSAAQYLHAARNPQNASLVTPMST
jgi:hypothetical protein